MWKDSFRLDSVPDLDDACLLRFGADLFQVSEGVGPLLARGLENRARRRRGEVVVKGRTQRVQGVDRRAHLGNAGRPHRLTRTSTLMIHEDAISDISVPFLLSSSSFLSSSLLFLRHLVCSF